MKDAKDILGGRSFAELSAEEKVRVLLKLREHVQQQDKSPLSSTGGMPALRVDPASRHEPFPLTDLQASFLAGKQLGKLLEVHDTVGCHVYWEIQVRRLDIPRLNAAWNRLIEHHEMLRAVVSADGQQRIQPRVPKYEFTVDRLEHAGADERERRFAAIRERLSHRIYEAGEWPLFAVHVSVLPEDVAVIHLSIDEWIVDGMSLNLLLDQWQALYDEPSLALPRLELSFRDYVLALKSVEGTEAFRRSLAYWLDKLDRMPGGPGLPRSLAKRPAREHMQRERLFLELEREQWQRLKASAQAIGVSPANALLTLFSTTLSTWSSEPRFGVILTFFNRLPLHPQVEQVVGPFISTNLFLFEETADRTLEEAARAHQQQLWKDLDHVSVSGVRALQEHKRRRRAGGPLDSLNVVFTNLLNNAPETAQAGERFRDKLTYFVTQTPQVYLDCQINEREGNLYVSWDVARDYFAPGSIERIFEDFRAALGKAASADWSRTKLAELVDHGASGVMRPPARYAGLSEVRITRHAAHEKTTFPLTEQQAAYAFSRLDPRVAARGSCTVYQEIDIQQLDVSRLEAAWNELIRQHEMLRCVPHANGSQQVLPVARPYPLTITDLRGQTEEQRAAALEKTAAEMTAQVFPLGEWPLFAIRVSRLDDRAYRVHFLIDMLIADGRSIQTLCLQWLSLYESPGTQPPQPEVSFRDYVLALEGLKRSEQARALRGYWENKFKETPPGPVIPHLTGTPEAAKRPTRFERLLPGWSTLVERARRCSVAPGTVLLTAYMEQLSAWAQHTPFTVVVVNWERPPVHQDVDRIIGDFTALAWVVSADPALPFLEKLQHYERSLRSDLSHSLISGIDALRKVSLSAGSADRYRFPVVFTNLIPDSKFTVSEQVRFHHGTSKTPGVDLDCVSNFSGDTVHLSFDAAVDTSIPREIFEGYCQMVELLARPESDWARLELPAAKRGQLRAGKEPALSVLRGERGFGPLLEKTLYEHIEESVRTHADRIAVEFEGERLSFRELNERANRCAHYLRSVGVGPDRIVGVLMTRSTEMVVALLGILKAGGAYLPLDPMYPTERLAFLIQDAAVPVVLTQRQWQPKLQGQGVPLFCLDTQGDVLARFSAENPGRSARPDDLAYVIYTSGSTGKPKGCLITHRGVCNRLFWMQERYAIGPSDCVLQKTPYTFDVSVWEFFWPLLTGARLLFAKPEGHTDSGYLVRLIQERQVTVCHFVPSMLGFFLREPDVGRCVSLRRVFTSGEALPYRLMSECLQKLKAGLHNLYGPTEASVDVTYWDCEERPDKKVPIGQPVTNTDIFVLDASLKPVPWGEEGELFLGGIQLARGYLNRPELTAERFVEISHEGRTERIYKTGDRGRILPDGTVEYLGRLDFQVKVRGFRIELGEIEAALEAMPGVRAAVVLVRDETTEDPKLVAYLETAHGVELSIREVRRFLGDRLPPHMVPNAVVRLDKIPVNVNGKLDRKALPWPPGSAVDRPGTSAAGTAPAPARQEIAAVVSALFREALHLDTLDEDGDLFEYGATSLTLVSVTQQIRAKYQVELPVDQFLQKPTLGWIVSYIAKTAGGAAAALVEAVPERTSSERAPEPVSAPHTEPEFHVDLEPVWFTEERYFAGDAPRSFKVGSVELEQLGRLLSLLKHQYSGQAEKPQALFPSAGGKYGVQTYVYAQAGRIPGLDEGLYYYHPVEHVLCAVRRGPRLLEAAFREEDRGLLQDAAFAVFFIVELKALEPVYQDTSRALASVEAGYMAQLLLSREEEFELGLHPVPVIDFDSVRPLFALSESQGFLHCLVGGRQRSSGEAVGSKGAIPPAGIARALEARGLPLEQRYRGQQHVQPLPAKDYPLLSEEEVRRIEREKPYLRALPEASAIVRLASATFPQAAYRQRASQRQYASRRPRLQELSGLLSLLRCRFLQGRASHLFPSLLGVPVVEVYLLIKEGAVEGLPGGTYRYHPVTHRLSRVRAQVTTNLVALHTPYNRKHSQASAFSLFFVCDPRRVEPLLGRQALHLAQLEVGAMGQVLMDHQAEFQLGLCPIGGLYFDPLRPELGLGPDHVLLHGMVGGAVDRPDYVPLSTALVCAPEGPALSPVPRDRTGRKEIAIVGVSGRYPGAESLDELWGLLREGRSSISEVPRERWDAERFFSATPAAGKSYAKWGGFLSGIDRFDNLLFNISPREARLLDPQERLSLEVVWECLENAGHTAASLEASAGKVGVFVGAMWSDYQNHGVEALREGQLERSMAIHSSIANRISYYFDFKGPSVALDTSCSSALSAIHLACESLARGECRAAVVVGVNLLTHPYHHNLLCQLGLVARDARSAAFSAQATGWVPGEGVGAILIRPLTEALAQRDHVHGVIRGTAVSHTGRGARYGAPNTESQAESIRAVLADAGLAPDAIGYIESSATGAGLADASEIHAIKKALEPAGQVCLLGSIKPNLGHLESASGMSQLAKVLLQLRHGEIAPTRVEGPLNPLLQLEGSGLELCRERRPWRQSPRRALINGFGATGSGAHVIVEQFTRPAPVDEAREETRLFVLSAASQEQLKEAAGRLARHLEREAPGELPLRDVAHTLRVGRVPMKERLAIIASTRRELVEKLTSYAEKPELLGGVYSGRCEDPSRLPAVGPSTELADMARQWVLGASLPEPKDAGVAHRVPLPSYPFARERHWARLEPQPVSTASVTAPASAPVPAEVSAPTGVAAEDVAQYLRRIVARALDVAESRIDSRTPLESYGLTSLMVQELNAVLARDLGETSKTLFFQFPTLAELAKYLAEERAQELHKLLGSSGPVTERPRPSQAESAPRRAPLVHAQREAAPPATLEIAIVGVGGRYPQARNLEEFWENLKQGRDCITEIPRERWAHDAYFDLDRDKLGKTYSRWGSFLEDHDKFDPAFFSISPAEVRIMDPQERLFLEVAWEALENANCPPRLLQSRHQGRVGVFAGVMYGEYQLYSATATGAPGVALGSVYGSIANRVSYFLNLNGPSFAVDTLCSSSLTAIHLAISAIRQGDCELAIAGGVNLSLHPNKYVLHAQAGMSSSDGRCRSFGKGGDGFVPGEGAGAVLLKPLHLAQRDGDFVYAVIKASALNHGGKTNGYTVPSPRAQAALIQQAIERAGIDPRTLSYVEAHGTGTALGDPIELEGLTAAFRRYTRERGFCAIGSVKSNVGHLEGAAGIAGVTKILLQMKHKTLVPSLHAEETNPNIDFAGSPFYVQREATPWEEPVVQEDGAPVRYPRRAAISSFGAGGANAHLLLEEYRNEERLEAPASEQPQLFVLSARNEERLRAYAGRVADFLSPLEYSGPGEAPTPEAGDPVHGREALLAQVASLLAIAPDKVAWDVELDELGFDLVTFGALRDWALGRFGVELPPVKDFATLESVAGFLERHMTGKAPERLARPRPVPEAKHPAFSLAELAYTSQVGREPMEERLALVVSSISELSSKLRAFQQGERVEGLQRGNSRAPSGLLGFFDGDEEARRLIESLAARRNLRKLAALWAGGVELEWELLQDGPRPRKVSLPTYPFARERHWLEQASRLPGTAPATNEPERAEPLASVSNGAARDLTALVREQLSALLQLPPERFEAERDLADYGVDSIVLTRLSNRLERALGTKVALADLMAARTVTALARLLESKRGSEQPESVSTEGSTRPARSFELSWEQQRYWDMSLLDNPNAALTLPFGFRLKGAIEPDWIEQSLQGLIDRHEGLRCTFRVEAGRVVQTVVEDFRVRLTRFDMSSEPEPDVAAGRFVRQVLAKRFELESLPPLRVYLVKLREQEHLLVINVHHIVFDAVSIWLFTTELAQRYRMLSTGGTWSPPALPRSYADYVSWERSLFERKRIEDRLQAWKRKVAGLKLGLDLPSDVVRGGEGSSGGAQPADPLIRQLEPSQGEAIRRFSAEHGLMPFSVHLTALGLLLYAMTENETIVIGNPVSNRESLDFEPILGLLANLSGVVLDFSGNPGLVELCQRSHAALRERDEHLVPYAEWVRVVQRERLDRSQAPLQAVLNYFAQPQAYVLPSSPGLHFEPLDLIRSGLGFSWFMTLVAQGDQLLLRLEYDARQFSPALASRFAEQYEQTLRWLVSSPQARLQQLFEQRSFGAVRPYHLRIASTFTAEPLEPVLRFWKAEAREPVKVAFAGYNQIFQELLDPASLLSSNPRGLNVLLLRMQDWAHPEEEEAPDAAGAVLLQRVEELIEGLKSASRVSRAPFLLIRCPDSPGHRADDRWARSVTRAWERLKEALPQLGSVFLMAPEEVLELHGLESYDDPELDHLAKVPYTEGFFASLGTAIMRKLYRVITPAAKVLVLDCDNTLWKGVVGEDGAHGIVLDGAHRALQEFALRQQEAGTLICLCSKNEEKDVLEVFQQRPDMVLKQEHLVAHKINWNPKSANIQALAAELNLGEDSFVFIDDNPVEIEEVRAHCPGVLALQFPQSEEEARRFLRHLWSFDRLKVTEEDRQRTQSYQRSQHTKKLLQQSSSFEAFIEGLQLVIEVTPLTGKHLARASQLTFRTNQFNATTLRRTEQELEALLQQGYAINVVHVRDRFGDHGLVGLVIHQARRDALFVDTLLMSCRVLGRGVEHEVVRRLAKVAEAAQLPVVRIPFVPTQKNRPMQKFLDEIGSGYRHPEGEGFVYALPVAVAGQVRITLASAESEEGSGERAEPVTPASGGKEASRNRFLERACREYGLLDALLTGLSSHGRREAPRVGAYTPPSSDLQKSLARIWMEVLNLDRVGIDEDFFLLGGTSLDLVRVLAETRKVLGRVLSQDRFMQGPTIAAIAAWLENDSGSWSEPLVG
jgi:amino acid adenylation domain-containing protein/FkbH-like protein